jgi:histidine triad (HIT) family protein
VFNHEPDAHRENLYDLPARYGHAAHDLVRDVAVAMRETYGCGDTSFFRSRTEAG